LFNRFIAVPSSIRLEAENGTKADTSR